MTGPSVVAKSQRDLARKLGKDPAAVNRWVRDDRWPFSRRGPWDVAKVKACAATTLAPDPAEAVNADGQPGQKELAELSPGRRVDMALKLTRQQKLKFELDKLRGEFHRIDECRARRVRQLEEFKRRLLNLADGLPFEPDVKELVRNRLLGVLRELASAPTAGA